MNISPKPVDREAQMFLKTYLRDQKPEYPLNPFMMLREFGIPYAFRDFKTLEGLFVPAKDDDDTPVVGININRPIERQRFTAAHELCHYVKGAKFSVCSASSNDPAEKFAEGFAASLLMPCHAFLSRVEKNNNCETLDDILRVADYFGVSFEACFNRLSIIEPRLPILNTSKTKRRQYGITHRRKELGLSSVALYEGLINAMEDNWGIAPREVVQYVFENNYVYNDSRMEGVEVTLDEAAEIVADLRIHGSDSAHSREENKNLVEVAGHAEMYQLAFSELIQKDRISVFDLMLLNKKLFSCAPHPESAGYRESDTIVTGGGFETTHYTNIARELFELEELVKQIDKARPNGNYTTGEIARLVSQLHHRLTVIHPCKDGNGRTIRAFCNMLLVRNGLPPVYFKIGEKAQYIEALAAADIDGNIDDLQIEICKSMIRTHMELTNHMGVLE